MRLTLLVPELIWSEPTDAMALGKLELPGFEWFAARAVFRHAPRQAFESSLAGCFGYAGQAYAPLRLLGEESGSQQEADEGVWLCADPVHLRFYQERIILADSSAFEIHEDEAEALLTSLNETFGDVGEFRMATARRWYLHLKSPQHYEAEPLSAIAGRRLDGGLPEHRSALHCTWNEVQMFLHTHPVNVKREARGELTINSLWFWGAGSLPTLSAGSHSSILCNVPLGHGFGRATGIAAFFPPANLAALLADKEHGRSPLLVLDDLLAPMQYEDVAKWRESFQLLDQRWFLPARKALGRSLSALTLIAPTHYGELFWTIEAKDRWKFWRKRQPLSTIASELAKGNP